MNDAAIRGVAAVVATKALDSVPGEFGRTAWTRLTRLLRLHEPEDYGLTDAVEAAWSDEVTDGSVDRIRRSLADRAAAEPAFAVELHSWWVATAAEVGPQLPPITEIRAEIHAGGSVGSLIQANQVHGGITITSPSDDHGRP